MNSFLEFRAPLTWGDGVGQNLGLGLAQHETLWSTMVPHNAGLRTLQEDVY